MRTTNIDSKNAARWTSDCIASCSSSWISSATQGSDLISDAKAGLFQSNQRVFDRVSQATTSVGLGVGDGDRLDVDAGLGVGLGEGEGIGKGVGVGVGVGVGIGVDVGLGMGVVVGMSTALGTEIGNVVGVACRWLSGAGVGIITVGRPSIGVEDGEQAMARANPVSSRLAKSAHFPLALAWPSLCTFACNGPFTS